MSLYTSDSDSHPNASNAPLLQLTASHDSDSESAQPTTRTTQVNVGSVAVKLDDLGPMVVNSDGTLSRISNWANMSEPEKERTLRVLSARNKIRLENEEKKLRDSEGTSERPAERE